MRNKTIISTLCSLFLFTASLSYASDTNKVLVTAGNATLTQSEFDEILVGMPPELKQMLEAQPELRTEMLSKWADYSILAQEAEAEGFGEKESAQRKIKEMRDRVMVQELIESQMSQTTISEKEVLDYYTSHQSEYPIPAQARVQHILVHVKDFNDTVEVDRANQKIQEIEGKLQAGESFATVAQQYSDDSQSKVKGGDVGFFNKGEIEQPFEVVAFTAPIGEVSSPIKTSIGFHIIKPTERKEAGVSPFEKEKENIRMKLVEEKNSAKVETLLTTLKEKYPITIH
jgi:parvulin-like peptidyl-prolyl isomerase